MDDYSNFISTEKRKGRHALRALCALNGASRDY